MVDPSELRNRSGKEKKEPKKTKKTEKKEIKSSGEPGTFSLKDDEKVKPGDVKIHDEAKTMHETSTLNYDKGTSSLRNYKKQQIKEVRELHDDMISYCYKYDDNIMEFTMVLQGALMSFAQNRVGIATTIQEQFGKSKKESLKITDEIVSKAGEDEVFRKISNRLTERLMSGG